MPLYGGIDLHANNSVVVLLNEQDHVVYYQRLNNHLPTLLGGCPRINVFSLLISG